jgi:hypothetical protein
MPGASACTSIRRVAVLSTEGPRLTATGGSAAQIPAGRMRLAKSAASRCAREAQSLQNLDSCGYWLVL